MRILIPLFLAVLLSGCAPETAQSPSPNVFGLSATVEQPETQNAAATPTASQTPTAGPSPIATTDHTITPTPWMHPDWPQNALPPMGDPGVLGAYYEPSPATVYGYLTRYGSEARGVRVGLWQLDHFREQLNRMEPLLGGGYSPSVQYDGQWSGQPTIAFDQDLTGQLYPSDITELTPAQATLYHLAFADDPLAELERFNGVIAMKSPNDIGRMFCVYRADIYPPSFVGRVLVMDTSAVNDYTGIGGTDGVPLGYRVTADPTGQLTHWVADMTDDIWDRTLEPGASNAWALMIEKQWGTGDGCIDPFVPN